MPLSPPTKQTGIQQTSHGILLLKTWMHCQMEMQSPGAGSRQGESLGFFPPPGDQQAVRQSCQR